MNSETAPIAKRGVRADNFSKVSMNTLSTSDLLAIGFAHNPDKIYPGRLPLGDFVYAEQYNQQWTVAKGREHEVARA